MKFKKGSTNSVNRVKFSLKLRILLPMALITSVLISIMLLTSYTQITDNLIAKIVISHLDSEINTIIDTMKSRANSLNITKKSLNEKNINLAKLLAKLINDNPLTLETSNMKELAIMLNVDEIHVTDENGIITHGNVEEFFCYDFKSSEQTLPFMKAIK